MRNNAAAENHAVQATFTYFSVSVKSTHATLQLNMDLKGEWIATPKGGHHGHRIRS